MKKLAILLMTAAMMLSLLSCGITPVLPVENAAELSTPDAARTKDAPIAQPLSGTGENQEILRVNALAAPATPSPTPSPTPAPVRTVPDAKDTSASAARTQSAYTNIRAATPGNDSAGDAVPASDNSASRTATVLSERRSALPDLLTAQNFPDPALLSQLREQYPDGLTAETIGSVTSFITAATVHDTTGIELLTGLEELRLVGMNDFPCLNVSTMSRLKTLVISSSALRSLDLSRNTHLQWLFFYGVNAHVSAVDLSACPHLERLYIESPITSLDLSGNPVLKELTLKGCKLDVLELGSNPELVSLDCSITAGTLDVSRCAKLETLFVSGPVTELDLSSNSRLTELSVNANLAELDLSHNTELTSLQCCGNGLKTLDVSMLPQLERLICYENDLLTLDLSRNPKLQALNCSENALSALDLSACTKLSFLKADLQSGISVIATEENGLYYLDFTTIVGEDKLDRVLDSNRTRLFANGSSGLLCLGPVCPDTYTYLYDTGCLLGDLEVILTVTTSVPPQPEIPVEPEPPMEPEAPVEPESPAEPTQLDWKSAYRSFKTETYVESYDYFLYDLNADGTPELFIVTGGFVPWLRCSVYSCTADGAVVKLGTRELGHSGIYGLSNEDALLLVYGHQGYYGINKWAWNGAALTEETLLPETNYGHDPYPYTDEHGNSLLQRVVMYQASDDRGMDWSGNPHDENHLLLAQGAAGQQSEPSAPLETLTEQETPAEPAVPDGCGDAAKSQAIFALMNARRTENGLPELSYSDALQAAANLRAQECAELFSHTRPDGTVCFTAFSVSYMAAGENIAMRSGAIASAEGFMEGWMNSQGHRENILSTSFTAAAVGVYYAPDGAVYATQLFVG